MELLKFSLDACSFLFVLDGCGVSLKVVPCLYALSNMQVFACTQHNFPTLIITASYQRAMEDEDCKFALEA